MENDMERVRQANQTSYQPQQSLHPHPPYQAAPLPRLLERNSLTGAEICSIIKQCRESEVAILKFGSLEVVFKGYAPEPIKYDSPAQVADAEISELQDKIEQKELEKDELTTREDQLAMMLIEDPEEAERLLLSGELESDVGTEE